MMTRKPPHRIVASVALAATMALLPATASIAQAQGVRGSSLALPVTGTATAVDGTLQTVTGTLNVQRFSRSKGHIFAEGTLVGTVASAVAGSPARSFVTQVSVPLLTPADAAATNAAIPNAVTAAASCDVLNLVLGPLDLNLLGLAVHLDQVVLDITAVPGAGNLLGNLLCAITGLLDGGGALSSVVALLNSLLGVLG